jgi:hypothetical protein
MRAVGTPSDVALTRVIGATTRRLASTSEPTASGSKSVST